MATYRLGSSGMVHTPGVIAWAINGYAFDADKPKLLKVMTETYSGVPVAAFRKLLSKKVDYEIEGGDTVVFTVEETNV